MLRRSALFLGLTGVLLLAHPCYGELDPDMVDLYGEDYFTVSPHWAAGRCDACHTGKVVRPDLQLRGDSITTCTTCHDSGKAIQELHQVGMKPSKRITRPEGFPLSSRGEISCLTCHDHAPVCRLEKKRALRLFLRGGPFEGRTDICFKCHDKDDVKGYNPHERQVKEGKIVERRCLFCHAKVPDATKQASRERVQLRTQASLVCIGCHLLTPHAGALEHLVTPEEETLKTLTESEKKHGVIFPLDEKGRISCFTCHNPHEKGVFEENAAAGRKAEPEGELELALKEPWPLGKKDLEYEVGKTRDLDMSMMELAPRNVKHLRLPAADGKLCIACHSERKYQ